MNEIEVLKMYGVVLNLPPLSTFYFPDIILIWNDFLLIFGWKAVLLLLKALASLLIYRSRSQTPNRPIKKRHQCVVAFCVTLPFLPTPIQTRWLLSHVSAQTLRRSWPSSFFFFLKDTKFPAKNSAKNQRWIERTSRHCFSFAVSMHADTLPCPPSTKSMSA